MLENTQQHFPEDRDAPVIKKSFVKEFYEKYRKPVDYIVFALILFSTVITVSLSIYIIIVKYI